MLDQLGRQQATQKTVDKWMGKPFAWGEADCAVMLKDHLKNMGQPARVAGARKWKTAIGATKALKRLKFDNLSDLIDDRGFKRINGAEALTGDICVIAADHPLGCLAVCIGPNQWLSLHEGAEGFTLINIVQFIGAWRVEWQKH